MLINNLKAQYEANKVNGRSEFCPREGVYKFLSFYNDTCLGKPALMAKVQWKPKLSDNYSEDLTFTIQVESLRNTIDTRTSFGELEPLINKEIFISGARYIQQVKLFLLKWRFLEQKQQTVCELLNKQLQDNPKSIILDNMLDSEVSELELAQHDFDYDNEMGDY
ncbi:MAG: hypothetical protein EOO44_11795 [Flavobacterium sp.]|uniref:hypothetical protein n=1 Tax=Pedobacter frigiditerrae TaxID=2530452 RepID=UPI0011F848BD|nr:hypothetical protein [Pedobacter frigiditerrae]RZJ52440.1 MAG: hypothetical protein EOO44_11795 [Flavobacterium sp.]